MGYALCIERNEQWNSQCYTCSEHWNCFENGNFDLYCWFFDQNSNDHAGWSYSDTVSESYNALTHSCRRNSNDNCNFQCGMVRYLQSGMGYGLSYEWSKQRNGDRYIHSKHRDFPEDSKADLQCDRPAQPRSSDHTTGNCTDTFCDSRIY